MSRVNMKKGDTLIEVVLSFVMFSLVVAVSISVMFSSISGAEAAMELSLARTEIDSQSETIRFIHEAYTIDNAYNNLWSHILEQVPKGEETKSPKLDVASCTDLYKENINTDVTTVAQAKAFVLNPRQVNNGVTEGKPDYYGNTLIVAEDGKGLDKFSTSSLNPRIIYVRGSSLDGGDEAIVGDAVDEEDLTSDEDINHDGSYDTVHAVEGIYDFIRRANDSSSNPEDEPSHYDFFVYTCWYAPGAEHPTTIGTVTRLYNPGYVKK